MRSVVGVYVLALVGWVVLRRSLAARFGLFQLIDIFGAWFYVPLAPLLLLLARRGWAGAIAGLLTSGVVFVSEYGRVLLPRAITARGTPLRVMTSNLMWLNADAQAFATAVARAQPDLVAVQELTWTMAGPLAEALKESYPYQVLAPTVDYDGIGLFSRMPLETTAPAAPGQGTAPSTCQSVTLRLGGRLIEVLNAHPLVPRVRFRRLGPVRIPVAFDHRTGHSDRRKLLARIDARSTPLVLLGDLNTADRQPYYRELRRRLADAHCDAGWGFGWTFPSPPAGATPIPLVRIDYVMHSPEWRAMREWTGYLASSDHRYVVADLVLLDDGRS